MQLFYFCRHVTYVACLHIYLVFSVDKLLVDINMSNVDKIIASRYKSSIYSMLILISCVTHVGSHMLAILDNLTFYEFYLINFRNLTYQQIINFFCMLT